MMSLWTKFSSALRAFRIARGGNVAITFAFATLPIIAGVGFAVDYSHANSVKVAMQQALDATALMLSKEAATDTSDQLKANAVKYFNALFTRPEAQNVTVTATYDTNGGTAVVINGSADVPTSLLGIIGYDSITVTSSSTTKWGSNLLRVALVLDNTGSMSSDGKMGALQSATKSLLTQLQNAASTDGDVYVSIVPFVKDVNLGAGNWNSDYLYWDDVAKTDNNSWDANNGTCNVGNYSNRNSCLQHSSCSLWGYSTQSSCTSAGTCSVSGNNSQSSCTSAGTCSVSGYSSQNSCTAAGTCSKSGYTSQSSCTSAGSCSNSGQSSQSSCTGSKACSNPSYTSKSSCQSHGGSWGYGTWTAATWTPATWTAATWTPGVWTQATWTPNNHNTWNGCVVDRGNSNAPDSVGNYDTNAVAPSTTIASTLYAAEQYGSCPQAVMGLNYNWTSMKSVVDNMSPAGNTNQAIGLQLGWMSLVGGGPFSKPAENPSFTYSHIIIMLTDGLNTQDRWYSNQNSIDARQQLTCDNIKAAGITLYTIQVNTGGDPTSTLLQNCASTSDKFYLLTSASQIVTAFTAIGTNLTQLRVAK